MPGRTIEIYEGGELSETLTQSTTWRELRMERDGALKSTDWRFMSDQTPSDEWISYRVFLRNLPQNYDTADDADDAWAEYAMPED
jgi:hypothetical protein